MKLRMNWLWTRTDRLYRGHSEWVCDGPLRLAISVSP